MGTVRETEDLTSEALLARFAATSSEELFAALVQRHLPMVYRTALRLTGGDTHRAEDVSQIVFADLAQKADRISSGTLVGGWLYRHTWFTAAKLMRSENRRALREQEANIMEPHADDSQSEKLQLAELETTIDAALNTLSESDRNALVLRYFEEAGLRRLGQVLGVSEDAAQKRVARALEKLRNALTARGSTVSTATVASALALLTSDAAVPVALTPRVLGAAATASTTTGFMTKLFYSGKMKTAVALVATVGVGLPLLQQNNLRELRRERDQLRTEAAKLEALESENERLRKSALSDTELARLKSDRAELQKLRGEITLLRDAFNKLNSRPTTAAAQPESLAEPDEQLNVTVSVKVVELKHELVPDLQKLGLSAIADPSDFTFNINEPISERVFKFFSETPGIEILSAPTVSTANHREASISVTDENTIDGQTIPVGVTVNILPDIQPDKTLIDLRIQPRMTVLVDPNYVKGASPAIPAFRTWSGDLGAVVASGNTLLLGRTPKLSREIPGAENKLLIFCITPTITNNKGERFHASTDQ